MSGHDALYTFFALFTGSYELGVYSRREASQAANDDVPRNICEPEEYM